jgi:hypothetical protein
MRKEVNDMILFTILALSIIAFAILAAITVGVGGVTIIVLFGDVIVCALLITFIVKCLKNKTWNKNK